MPNKVKLSLSSTVVRSAGVVEAEIDGEVVAMNIETGNCYGLNTVGSRVWFFLSEPVQIDSICKKLNAEYDVDAETCERQVFALLDELYAENLISAVQDK